MSSAPRVLVFETTHHALWAEEVARELRVGAEVVPAPPDSRAGCDLALQVLEEDTAVLVNALREHGIVFRVFETRPDDRLR